MKTVEWQPLKDITQTTGTTDVIQEDDFYLEVPESVEMATFTVEITWTDPTTTVAAAPRVALDASDDPATGNWSEVWNAYDSTSTSSEGSWLVNLSRSIQIGRPFRLANYIRWRVTNMTAAAEIVFRIIVTM